MRIAIVVFAFVLGLDASAHAAKFSCSFQGGQPQTCSLDSLSQNNPACQQNFSPTLVGACQANPFNSNTSQLVCFFAERSAAPVKFQESQNPSLEGITKEMAEKPGYRTVAIEWVTATGIAPLSLAYVEKTGAPVLAILCTPVH